MHLIQHFFNLVLLRAKPQELAYSKNLLTSILLLFLLMSIFGSRELPNSSFAQSFITIVLLKEVVFLLALYTLLKLSNKANRFVQTASNFVALAIIQGTVMRLVFGLTSSHVLAFFLISWFLYVNIYVTRCAFEVKPGYAVLTYLLINIPANILAVILLFSSNLVKLFAGV